MKIRYIYDYSGQQKRPIACLVACGDNVGISVCGRGDKFNKKRAVDIACGRAVLRNTVNVPNRRLVNFRGDKTTLRDEVSFYLQKM